MFELNLAKDVETTPKQQCWDKTWVKVESIQGLADSMLQKCQFSPN